MTGEEFDAKAAAGAFGQRVRELRDREGLTQDRLAKLSGMQSSAVGRFERGKHDPRLSTVLAIAQGLGVSPGELLDTLGDTPRGREHSPRSSTPGSAFPERWPTSGQSTSSKPQRRS
jgi:transcriptional regulator with XRE-family HTH domain